MARLKGGFSLYKRTTSKGKVVYYAKIPNGNPALPELKISTRQTSKASAAIWTQTYIENLANEEKRKEEERLNILFSEFAVGFWEHEGAYAVSRRARLRTISRSFLDSREGVTRNHLIPYWGKFKLKDITPRKIDRWVIDMASDNRIAPGTINQRLQVLRVMLDQACTQEYLTDNPAQYVKPVGNRYKEKGVLSPDEVKALLNPHIWKEYKHYAINLLTLSTGLRISEVRGLQVHQVHSDYIEVHTAWEEGYGLKEPKCGSVRDLPITSKVSQTLMEVIRSTGATHLVFFGATKETPLTKSCIEKNLYRTLERIGIDELTRKQRNLTFHSHRHTLNTLMRSAGIADSKVRMMTGHREASMTERYTHFRLHDLKEINSLQVGLESK